MDQGLKQMFSTMAVSVVIFLFAFGFWVYDKRRKRKEKKLNDSSILKPSKISLAKQTSLTWDENLTAQIVVWAQQNNARIITGIDDSYILYLNERGRSQFDGFLNIPLQNLPVRVLFINRSNQLYLRFDEDWGFNMFVGPAASAFKKNYAMRLDTLFNEILVKLS